MHVERSSQLADARPNIPYMLDQIKDGANIHKEIGSVVTEGSRIVSTLSSLGSRVEDTLDAGFARLYSLPPGRVSRHFANGFQFVTGQLFSVVVDVSVGIDKVSLESVPARTRVARQDTFEEQRTIFERDISKKTTLREPDPQELLASLKNDQSGVTWLRTRVEREYQDSEVEMDDAQRIDLIAGAASAIQGIETLYEALKVA